MDSEHWFIRNEDELRRHELIRSLSDEFAKNASKHDREGSFPHENIALLRNSGYVRWTLPKEYGGEEISLYEMILHQEQLARGDGSTALAIGWHDGIMFNLTASRGLPEEIFAEICRSTVERGALINSCASEPATGSPSRGGRPETTATSVDGGYRITGRKTYSSLSPALDWVLTTASIEGTSEVGEFLVRGEDIQVIETWNTMGMRATGSHDIELNNVFVPEKYLVGRASGGHKSERSRDGSGWQLHIPACYLGIALNARDFAVDYAAHYQPNSLPHPISEVEHVQNKIGNMELKLLTARTLMYDIADRWDRASHAERPGLRPQLAAVKTYATNTAIEVVDLAMRIVGGNSLSRDQVLERLYRDVRAGLHNPPADDITFKTLSTNAVSEFK